MVLPSGDQAGCRASSKPSVRRRAVPPVAGSVQMLPWRSIASVRPSGDAATAMEVPSRTVIVVEEDGTAGAGAPPVHAVTTATVTVRIGALRGTMSRMVRVREPTGSSPLILLAPSLRQRGCDQLGERLARAWMHEGGDLPRSGDELGVSPGCGRCEQDDAASD